jgi:hypothetical protein
MRAGTMHGPSPPARRRPARDGRALLRAWLAATVLSGIPSTAHALATGADPWAATRAAGAMLVGADASFATHLGAAALVHGALSTFWIVVLAVVLPWRRPVLEAVAASAAIGAIDLLAIAPLRFPEVAALPFWPQMADHLAWGACLGLALRRPPDDRDGRSRS